MSDAVAVHGGMSRGSVRGLARGLGWFSIALGMTEVIAPGKVAKMLGMQGQESVIRAYGVREITSGFGILASKRPAPWLWSRVGGDVLDIATLVAARSKAN